MSALPPKADIRQRIDHVCFVPEADIPAFNPCLAEVPLDYGITLCCFVGPIGAEFGCSLQRFEVDVHRTENTKARNCQLAPVSLGVKIVVK